MRSTKFSLVCENRGSYGRSYCMSIYAGYVFLDIDFGCNVFFRFLTISSSKSHLLYNENNIQDT